MSITISSAPEKLENGRYLISDNALMEIREQIRRNNIREALLSFSENTAGYDGSSAAEQIADDEKLLDVFCNSLEKYISPWDECWTFSDLVLTLDDNLNDYDFAPAAESIIRENVLDIAERFGLRFFSEEPSD